MSLPVTITFGILCTCCFIVLVVMLPKPGTKAGIRSVKRLAIAAASGFLGTALVIVYFALDAHNPALLLSLILWAACVIWSTVHLRKLARHARETESPHST